MTDAAVLFATAASIFGAPALALLIAVRDFRRWARADFSPTPQNTDIGGAAVSDSPISSLFPNAEYYREMASKLRELGRQSRFAGGRKAAWCRVSRASSRVRQISL